MPNARGPGRRCRPAPSLRYGNQAFRLVMRLAEVLSVGIGSGVVVVVVGTGTGTGTGTGIGTMGSARTRSAPRHWLLRRPARSARVPRRFIIVPGPSVASHTSGGPHVMIMGWAGHAGAGPG